MSAAQLRTTCAIGKKLSIANQLAHTSVYSITLLCSFVWKMKQPLKMLSYSISESQHCENFLGGILSASSTNCQHAVHARVLCTQHKCFKCQHQQVIALYFQYINNYSIVIYVTISRASQIDKHLKMPDHGQWKHYGQYDHSLS